MNEADTDVILEIIERFSLDLSVPANFSMTSFVLKEQMEGLRTY